MNSAVLFLEFEREYAQAKDLRPQVKYLTISFCTIFYGVRNTGLLSFVWVNLHTSGKNAVTIFKQSPKGLYT
ncbi:MAG: hypothetical protein E3K32_09765, partial [wastewater metagenome]|nr:hypothetical protein [Candidatus Loosdrechtia aerotolerans]